MPKGLWQLPWRTLNFKQKRLLAFFWWCAPDGCHCWNGRLAKRFRVSPRTIRRWISNLKKLELIAIGFPDGRGRTIWPRYKPQILKSQVVHNPKKTAPGRTKMSGVDNAQHNNYSQGRSYYTEEKKDGLCRLGEVLDAHGPAPSNNTGGRTPRDPPGGSVEPMDKQPDS